MSSVTSRITIGRPIEDVFAILTDVEKTGLWYPVDVEEHWTSPPPLGVGSMRHAVVRSPGVGVPADRVDSTARTCRRMRATPACQRGSRPGTNSHPSARPR